MEYVGCIIVPYNSRGSLSNLNGNVAYIISEQDYRKISIVDMSMRKKNICKCTKMKVKYLVLKSFHNLFGASLY